MEVEDLLVFDSKKGLEEPIPIEQFTSLAQEGDHIIGRRIGEFTVQRLIGKGGMGHVWEAEQEKPRRRVAIKVLRRGIVTREALRRFELEVELLGRLQHQFIAQVYAAGTIVVEGEQVPYFAMELVTEGRTLDAFVAEKKLSLEAQLRLFVAICDAVQHAHQRGVIHRDLKPSNILIDPEGSPRIIDFGVARATNSDLALTTQYTRAGELVGTLAYMSPEQCEADPAKLDSRTDIYSLGVILYELICGQLPYDLKGRSLLTAALLIREQVPLAPRLLVAGLGRDLEAVILKCLEKEPQRRYPSSEALATDLRRHLDGDPVEARPPGTWRKVLRWIGRHPVATTAAVCASMIALSLGSLFLGTSLATTPGKIELDSSYREATLFSVSRTVLHRWRAQEGRLIRFAELVDPPTSHQGPIVAIGLDSDPGSVELCLFESRNLETPYWTSAAYPLRPPQGTTVRPNSTFIIQCGIVADVFPELLGMEIVVLHRIVPDAATCIRVYGLDGALLYEAWHDGGLHDVQWLAGPGVLVVSGVNSERTWSELGFDMSLSLCFYPAVVFALKPERGRTNPGRFLVHEGVQQAPDLLWYQWLGPPTHLAVLDDVIPYLRAPEGSWSAREHVQVDLTTTESSRLQPPPVFSLILDKDGLEVARVVGDRYKRWENSSNLPAASVYRLYKWADFPLH